MSFVPPDLSLAIPPPGEIAEGLAATRADRGGFGEPLFYFPTIGSTNDAAARLAEAGAEEGTTVAAGEQTEGRGRLGRRWCSPAGAGLYVSVIVRPGAAPRKWGQTRFQGVNSSLTPLALRVQDPPRIGALPALLTLAAGVALATAVREATGLQAEIKWPNDVMCGRRKLAGILAEAAARGPAIDYVVVGFGINILAAAYPPEVADRATSIEAELGRGVDRGLLLGRVLARFAAQCVALRGGRGAAIIEAWRRLAPSAEGRPVAWRGADGPRRGTSAGLDTDGALLVEADGVRERIVAGDITWL